MSLSTVNFTWPQGKRTPSSLHNYPVPVLGWDEATQKLYPFAVNPSGNVSISEGGSGLPFGADAQVITYTGANIATIVFKKAGVTLKTRTFSYTSGNLTGTVDA